MFTLPNRFVDSIPCTEAQYKQAVKLSVWYNQTLPDHWTKDSSGFMMAAYGKAGDSLYIGIAEDGTSHS